VGTVVLLVGYAQQSEPAVYISDRSFDGSTNKLTVFDHDKAIALDVPANFMPQLSSPDGKQSRNFPLAAVRGRMQVRDYTLLGSKRDAIATLNLVELTRRIPAETARSFLLGLVFVEAAVILLVVTNSAASTVTREKEDGTLDLLLTSPITSRYYIWGKLRGLVYFVLPLIAVPAISVAMFIAYDSVSSLFGSVSDWVVFPEALFLLPLTLVILATFAGITGMNLSLRCRTSVRAVMFAVAIVLGACGLLGFCGDRVITSSGDSVASLAVAAFSPFSVLMILVDPYHYGGSAFSQPDQQSTARAIVFVFALIATAAYSGIVWTMYKTMVKNFDMTIRKQSR
jgi:ABC-type transport system involved in multi-copper enzyme maturation permease subunit